MKRIIIMVVLSLTAVAAQAHTRTEAESQLINSDVGKHYHLKDYEVVGWLNSQNTTKDNPYAASKLTAILTTRECKDKSKISFPYVENSVVYTKDYTRPGFEEGCYSFNALKIGSQDNVVIDINVGSGADNELSAPIDMFQFTEHGAIMAKWQTRIAQDMEHEVDEDVAYGDKHYKDEK